MLESGESSAAAVAVGSHIGPYRIVRQLGSGGMGAIYEAIHETIERRVAVKVLLSKYAQDTSSISRLMNEARAVNRVGHPGLVQMYDASRLPDGTVYILMELLSGETLSERARRRRFTLLESLRLGRQIAGALAAAHDKGIIHRDLKPDNVMVVSDPDTSAGERSKILDFGIAKLVQTESAAGLATCPEVVLGTPLYMSPEQCRGAAGVDDRTDVYSFGVMLYWMLTGQTPFAGTLADVITKHLFADLPPLGALCPGAPTALVELVSDLMAKQPQQRPSMSKVTAVLGEIESQLTPRQVSESASGSLTSARLATTASSSPSHSVDISQLTPGSASLPAATPQAFALGNKSAPARSGRRGILLLAAAVLVLGAIGAASKLRPRHPPAVWGGEKNRPSVAAGAAPALPLPPARATARVVISSTPSGAIVLRAADRKPLGQTPWQRTRLPAAGEDELLISLPGYVEQRVRLPSDSDFTAQVALVAEQSDAASPRSPKVRPPARPYPLQKKRVTGDDERKPTIELEE